MAPACQARIRSWRPAPLLLPPIPRCRRCPLDLNAAFLVDVQDSPSRAADERAMGFTGISVPHLGYLDHLRESRIRFPAKDFRQRASSAIVVMYTSAFVQVRSGRQANGLHKR